MNREMKKSILIFFLILLGYLQVSATHQRAAEITYKHVTGLTYEAKIITYTYTPSPADRPELDIFWGDGTSSTLQRTQKIALEDNITLNVYEYNPQSGAITNRHTYSSPGTYTMYMEDPNRNYGVVNIPNSVNVPMYVQTTLVINPFLGYNNSPTLLNPPIDVGCVNQVFIHNPGAYDIDGDSLSYRLVNCKTSGGIDIPGFTQPAASNSFSVNPVTGDVIWDTPVMQGEYNIAFVIEEWRHGVKIGIVTRDMQIDILACSNNPPVIIAVDDTCVTAGSTITFDVTAYDIDGNAVSLTATGGPFEVAESPATINPDPAAGNDTVMTTFTWNTTCFHVQKQPFQIFFKAKDDDHPINLVSYKAVGITVVCPAPENLTANAVGSTIRLKWDRVPCSKASGYKIYRRIGSYGFVPGVCETGVPASTGFVFIHQVEGIADTTYIDDDNGLGLIHGNQYCYMVTAYFLDGAESYASLESCATLKRDIPVITNMSNDSSDLQQGRGFIAWSKPTELDTIQIPGPYQYVLYRSEGATGGNLQPVASLPGLDDTIFIDNGINLNNSGIPFSYRISLESLIFGFIGNSQIASSIFLNLTETDEEIQLDFQPNVPWLNDFYVIYRKDEGSSTYDSIGVTAVPFYSDTGLINTKQYCYYVKSVGGYTAGGFVDPIINYSQLICGIPYDNKPPCAPVLAIETNCDLAINTLRWANPDTVCDGDVAKYLIYFSPLAGTDFALIDSTSPASVTTYEHANNGTITGCYAVTAVDSVGNQSVFSNVACIDNDTCSVYSLPNVFTPNDDTYNDIYHPFLPYTSVERVEMTIFNRWGTIVFETEDPYINWDGKDSKTGVKCSDGVYFYVCKVYEITLYGVKQRELRGSITLLSD
jgi:gliding motility-associated-like protein